LHLRLHVRRFRCCTPECRRQIFTERLPLFFAPPPAPPSAWKPHARLWC
jgi:hypothetical protein